MLDFRTRGRWTDATGQCHLIYEVSAFSHFISFAITILFRIGNINIDRNINRFGMLREYYMISFFFLSSKRKTSVFFCPI